MTHEELRKIILKGFMRGIYKWSFFRARSVVIIEQEKIIKEIEASIVFSTSWD